MGVSPGIQDKWKGSTLASSWNQILLVESDVNGNPFQSRNPSMSRWFVRGPCLLPDAYRRGHQMVYSIRSKPNLCIE